MDALAIVVNLVLGALLGFAGGLFGVGGGIVAIPVLALAFGMPQQLAQGTALVMVVPNVLLGFWKYWRGGDIDLRYALALAASAVVCTIVAAQGAVAAHGATLRIAFAGFVIAMAMWIAFQTLRAKPPTPQRAAVPVAPTHLAWPWSLLVGVVGGTLSGWFGVGGATVAPPLLTGLFRFTQAQAQGLALALVAPGTIAGLATYARAGQVDWPQGLALAAGGVFAVARGVALARTLPERSLKLSFCVLLVVTAGVLLADAVRR